LPASCDPRPRLAVNRDQPLGPLLSVWITCANQSRKRPWKGLGLKRHQTADECNRVRNSLGSRPETASAQSRDCPHDGWPSDRRLPHKMPHTAITQHPPRDVPISRMPRVGERLEVEPTDSTFTNFRCHASHPGVNKRALQAICDRANCELRRYQDVPFLDDRA